MLSPECAADLLAACPLDRFCQGMKDVTDAATGSSKEYSKVRIAILVAVVEITQKHVKCLRFRQPVLWDRCNTSEYPRIQLNYGMCTTKCMRVISFVLRHNTTYDQHSHRYQIWCECARHEVSELFPSPPIAPIYGQTLTFFLR